MSISTEFSPQVFGSFTTPSDAELRQVQLDTARERAWLGDAMRFKDSNDITQAIEIGSLVAIEPTTKYRPLPRFFNPKLNDLYVAGLALPAAAALDEITDMWQLYAESYNVSPDARLAVTSLVRSEKHQRALVEAGKLAVIGSSHTTGLAFDIDRTGYYMMVDGEAQIVTKRPDTYRAEIAQQLEHQFGVQASEPEIAPSAEFDENVMIALAMAVEHFEGRVNAVPEYSGTLNSCLHIGVNPQYQRLAA